MTSNVTHLGENRINVLCQVYKQIIPEHNNEERLKLFAFHKVRSCTDLDVHKIS